MSEHTNFFAIVPAAGHSRRMGRPKLLLPVGDHTVIARMLDTLDRPEITETIVVIRPDDRTLYAELERTQATVFQPNQTPPEMRDSVAYALEDIRRRYSPMDTDGWLLIPADHPLLSREILDALLERWNRGDCRILVPKYQQKRGHPTIFCWELADEIDAIPKDRGLNWLMQKHADEVTELPIDHASIVTDLDSPSDYEALLRNLSN